MKKILLFFIVAISFATALDKNILLIEAKLYPKIAMLTNDFAKKKVIKVAIISNKLYLNDANVLKKFLSKNKNLKIEIIQSINLNYDVYILTSKIDKFHLQTLIKNKKIIFALNPNNIENAMFSIFIGARVYPYINPKLLKEAKIKINPILLKVGKIYDK